MSHPTLPGKYYYQQDYQAHDCRRAIACCERSPALRVGTSRFVTPHPQEAGETYRGIKQRYSETQAMMLKEALNKSLVRDDGFAGWDVRKVTRRMVLPRRAEQCLPKEDAIP